MNENVYLDILHINTTYISLNDNGVVLVKISEFWVNGLTGEAAVGVGGGTPSS